MKVKPILQRVATVSTGLIQRISWKGVAKRTAGVGFGIALLFAGMAVFSLGDPQHELYNAARMTYMMAEHAGEDGSTIHTDAQLLKAVGDSRQMFARSRQVYKLQSQIDAKSWLLRFLSPPPDQHLAAMAAFQEAKCYLVVKQGKLAVQSFRTYLEIEPFGTMDLNQEDTLIDIYDLEMLLKANPSLGQGPGQGQGQGQGNQGNEPAPGQQAGKGNPTKI